jgi:hypothetical protein
MVDEEIADRERSLGSESSTEAQSAFPPRVEAALKGVRLSCPASHCNRGGDDFGEKNAMAGSASAAGLAV